MPNRKRPFDKWSREATSFAVWICVALDYQADSSAEFEPLGDGGCGTQRDERIHHVEILFSERRFAERMGEPASHRHVRVFRHPQRLKAALLQRHRQIGRRHRIVGEKDRRPDFHVVPSQPNELPEPGALAR
jgi:hypothetical protein